MDKELIPEFETEEQEAEYWDTHSPLDVAAEPGAQGVRVRAPKDRPITIRLDSHSRRKLEELATESGLGPSTFARRILLSAIERGGESPRRLTLSDLREALEQNLPQHVKERAESLLKAISIGEPQNPAILLVDRSQMKEWEQLGLLFTSALLAMAGVQVVTSQDSEYEKLKSMTAGRRV
jgi:hypothetical protein